MCLLGVGKLVGAASQAAELLEASGIHASVWDVRVVRPPDPAMLAEAAAAELVVTVEDGIRVGGAGTFLADAIAGLDPARRCPPVLVLGLPHAYLAQGRPDAILARLGLDGPGIAASVLAAVAGSTASSRLVAPGRPGG